MVSNIRRSSRKKPRREKPLLVSPRTHKKWSWPPLSDLLKALLARLAEIELQRDFVSASVFTTFTPKRLDYFFSGLTSAEIERLSLVDRVLRPIVPNPGAASSSSSLVTFSSRARDVRGNWRPLVLTAVNSAPLKSVDHRDWMRRSRSENQRKLGGSCRTLRGRHTSHLLNHALMTA